MIIDTHTHIFDEKTYNEYVVKAGNIVKKILTIYEWLVADESGNLVKQNLQDFIEFVKSKENLYAIGAVDVDADIKKQLRELEALIKNKGIVGVKLYPGYQHFFPSDKKIYPIAKFCEEHQIPLIFHSGDFYDIEGKAILKYSHPIHIDGLATKFPNCTIIIAHFGFPYHLETASVVSKNKNVYTEVSGTLDETETKEEARNVLEQYTKDLKRVYSYFPDVRKKTMFGTDYSGESTPLNQVSPYINLIKRLFTKDEQVNVFYTLANKVFFK